MSLVAIVPFAASGCADDTVSGQPTAGLDSGTGGLDSTSDTGNDESRGGTGSGDTRGAEGTDGGESSGGPPVIPAQANAQMVGSGQRMSSANYTMVITLGQPTQLQSTHLSTNYTLRGGLIGANGSQP